MTKEELEKEAEKYVKVFTDRSYIWSNDKLMQLQLREAYKDGATFGYNKCAEEIEQEIVALKKDKEGLIFIRNQKAKCMCEDKQRLTKAKEIIRNLLRVTYEEGWNYSLDVKVEAERFLKESTDIREDTTLDGDWVVDDH